MAILAEITNWNELVKKLKDQMNVIVNGEINLDFSGVEEILDKYFPDIIELLKALVDNTKKVSGVQKMKGYHKQVISNKTYDFIFTPDEDVMLTGIAYAQSLYKCEDKFDLIVVSSTGEEFKLFESLYVKDCMQHKGFQVFFPVPQGYEVKLVMHNESGVTKDVWVDFEYLSVKGFDPVMGTIIIRYIGLGEADYILLAEETGSLDLGVHTIDNTREFEGYTRCEPTVKTITLTTEEPTRIVEFFYDIMPIIPEEPGITHDYDIKVLLRWENNSSVDIDMYGFINKDSNKRVSYRGKEYFETEEDKLWLDHDFTSHEDNGYESQPEIITILGFNRDVLSIQLNNFNNQELREDAVVEISRKTGEVLDSIAISRDLLNQISTRNIYVCDIDIRSNRVDRILRRISGVGEF